MTAPELPVDDNTPEPTEADHPLAPTVDREALAEILCGAECILPPTPVEDHVDPRCRVAACFRHQRLADLVLVRLGVERLTRERDEALAEVARMNEESMRHQNGQSYDVGYEHGSATAALFRDRAEKAEAEVVALRANVEEGEASDGHHTHNELYEYRLLYNAHAANAWARQGLPVVRSWRHSDGVPCFGGGWFIVTATLPTGQVSNHYPEADWSLFSDVPEVVLPPEYDGHTPADAARRLRAALAVEAPQQVEGDEGAGQ